jgi:hypothetical protein
MAAWQASYEIEVGAPWPADYAATLDRIARRERELIAGVQTWGHESGNRLDVYLEEAVPAGGLLRLDLRAWDAAFVAVITAYLSAWGAAVIAPDGSTVRPDASTITEWAAASPASRFVNDPDSFSRRVSLGDYTDG